MASTTRVLIVEDDPLALRRLVQAVDLHAADAVVAGCASTVAEALAWLAQHQPDVLLCDLGLPDGSGIDVIRNARVRYPGCDCMVVTVFGDDQHVLASIEAGAIGYLLKDETTDRIAASIGELRAGGSPMSPLIARQVVNRLRGAPPEAVARDSGPGAAPGAVVLSVRENEILDLISRGYTYAETARYLGLSVHTVQSHIKNIYGKLAVRSRGEAVFEAAKLGLLKSL
ncbi:putative TWO COMPONENT RESPONSE REGULATOR TRANSCRIPTION REGULATOR PROTEIN [Cupriavidus taiwanensis]|uniref:TWO COMPONENT RESPONSE REGULATOR TRANSCRIPTION REGULATOR PROTEIN n=1 Tax=Cupriavidus taiwanensis TaxID=164546 RepID=A0A976AZD9_9BURK|nr:response regulator transcription factor [Cupriavidus taiwanensis]SOZ18531.1 putative TWO COMPONENT RESPONSE REGULATOR TRANSCRIPTION REGULATOR PROTEIN [Cupriavidus taiwanensis]SOZ31664.1 putative TWO COMPONENT RESPONSE REGULATOR TRANSCRIPTION REGULATOR PROTEIN [Cupriavidus taiwanensis]SOZ47564.1 putative TWO COMPONENT RESPONSE REGULATOR TRANSCRIPTION REGULATOR PROTEIN [Cupriavidus taiwanensis]SOZ61700.1 putative TWO COMPONENT RESPONSE REGULATOR TRANSCRIPTION REGULATOR PROTEIN [Cupriavidus tai